MNDRVLSGNFHIYIYILLPSPSRPKLPPPPTPSHQTLPPLLCLATPARRRWHPLPCLISSLNRTSFPLTKILPPSPSLSPDFSSLPLRNPAADSGGLPPYLFLFSLSVFSTSSKILCSFPSSPSWVSFFRRSRGEKWVKSFRLFSICGTMFPF